jgi:hypothetical protein
MAHHRGPCNPVPWQPPSPYSVLGRMFDAVVHAEPTPRPVVEEVAQLLGFDPADVISVSITGREVAVVAMDRDDAGKHTGGRTLHRSVIV